MIVQIVLVIVTAVQVNSQQLCPSVCRCYSDWATCKSLFSDVTNKTQETFHSAVRKLKVTGSARLELEEDLFLRWNITSLTYLDLSYNNITKIWQRAFYSLADPEYLILDGNRITTLDSQTLCYNARLFHLSLSRNSIADIHPSTFQENIKLQNIIMDFNTITSLHPELFAKNLELGVVKLKGNRITDIHLSKFRNNRRLYYVNWSGNKIISIDPETFSQNVALKYIKLKKQYN
jgi:Leucine-rich repeat (LRR) protein